MKTKRSKAAMKLNAAFRMITTGTPVENHLDELWTLFNFLNPGLLGGFEKFKKDDYDLCILDVMMPYKDGFTLAKEIRERNKDVPIIFLTAKALKEDVLKGYKVGADDYLNKPFDSEVLLMKIKAIIQLHSVFEKSSTLPTSTKTTLFFIYLILTAMSP